MICIWQGMSVHTKPHEANVEQIWTEVLFLSTDLTVFKSNTTINKMHTTQEWQILTIWQKQNTMQVYYVLWACNITHIMSLNDLNYNILWNNKLCLNGRNWWIHETNLFIVLSSIVCHKTCCKSRHFKCWSTLEFNLLFWNLCGYDSRQEGFMLRCLTAYTHTHGTFPVNLEVYGKTGLWIWVQPAAWTQSSGVRFESTSTHIRTVETAAGSIFLYS